MTAQTEGLPAHIDDACDTIDAAIFTGDIFYADATALDQFEVYLARWQRGIRSIKEFWAEQQEEAQ